MFEPKILLSDFKGMYVFQPPGHGQPLPLLHIQDKVNQQTRHHFASISNVIWIVSSDTICQLNQLISNSGAATLSIKQFLNKN